MLSQPEHNQEAISLEIDADKLLVQAVDFDKDGETLLGLAFYNLSIGQRERASLHRLAEYNLEEV
jgi:hypothetical protein